MSHIVQSKPKEWRSEFIHDVSKSQLSYTMNTLPFNIKNNNTMVRIDKCNACLCSYNIYGENINVGAYFTYKKVYVQKLSRYEFSILFSTSFFSFSFCRHMI